MNMYILADIERSQVQMNSLLWAIHCIQFNGVYPCDFLEGILQGNDQAINLCMDYIDNHYSNVTTKYL